ncbi:MAG: DNA ligase-1 [Myxococcota bacterium]|jgi:DNA ligase-1
MPIRPTCQCLPFPEVAVHTVRIDEVRDWLGESGEIRRLTQSIGHEPPSAAFLEEALGLPLHVEFAMRKLVEHDPAASLDLLASIPFYSLCTGLFVPLSGMAPEKVASLFGFATPPPPPSG